MLVVEFLSCSSTPELVQLFNASNPYQKCSLAQPFGDRQREILLGDLTRGDPIQNKPRTSFILLAWSHAAKKQQATIPQNSPVLRRRNPNLRAFGREVAKHLYPLNVVHIYRTRARINRALSAKMLEELLPALTQNQESSKETGIKAPSLCCLPSLPRINMSVHEAREVIWQGQFGTSAEI